MWSRTPSLHEGNAKGERSAELGPPADDRDRTSSRRCLLDLGLLFRKVKLERLEQLGKECLHFDDSAKAIRSVNIVLHGTREIGKCYAREPPTDASTDPSSYKYDGGQEYTGISAIQRQLTECQPV